MADNTQQNPAQQTAEAVHTSGRATSDAVRRGGELAVDATRRAGQAGAEALNRSGRVSRESLRQGTQDLAESQRQIVQNAAEQFEQLSRKVAEAIQGTSEDVHSLMVLPDAAWGGLQDLQHGVTDLIEGVVRTNLRATQELIRLANPGAYVELQYRFVRQYLDALIENSVTLVRAVRRTADETLGPLETAAPAAPVHGPGGGVALPVTRHANRVGQRPKTAGARLRADRLFRTESGA